MGHGIRREQRIKIMNKLIKKYSREILLAVLILLAYVPAFQWMWGRWSVKDTYYSHGMLVPFVSLFFVWQLRDELKKIQPTSSKWGIPLIVTGLTIHMASSLMRVYFTSGFSFLLVLFGWILYFFGAKITRKVAFPAGFIFFMIPLPLEVISNVSFRLKILAADIATVIVNQMGILAIQKGSMIIIPPNTQVIVDDVCSGVRSLIALMALGSIFAYWLKGSMIRRGCVFLSTIPIAIITNVCRVIILTAVSAIWGVEYVKGFVHDFTGFMVFGIAFLLLYATTKLVE